MSSQETDKQAISGAPENPPASKGPEVFTKTSIGDSIDFLVEYLVDNEVEGIHPLIMGEVEKRLLIKALEQSRGNKLRAAKILGISRNTFHRKLSKLGDFGEIYDPERES